MSVLEGSNIDPRVAHDAIERSEVMKEGKRKELRSIVEDLAKWKTFFGTKTGQVVSDLADPLIENFKREICSGVAVIRTRMNNRGLVNISDREIERYQDECRGALREWETIKYRSEVLERRLKELQDAEEKLDVEQGKSDKKQSPSEVAVPKEVAKYA
jgi:hypothetical protein